MVSHRDGFQRVYDLPENIIPSHIDTSTPDWREYYSYLIQNTLHAQGIASRNELFHLRHIDHAKFDQVLRELLEERKIVPVKIEQLKTMYTMAYYLDPSIKISNRVSILSPFDNLIIWRNRLKGVFDFDYTLECYLPAHKRAYGYFCLPVLMKDKFIGRMDVKANRKTSTLEVKKTFWQDQDLVTESNLLFETTLDRFARFNQCDWIIL